ncbi:MAG: hypothetical protein NWP80_01380 [Candidatus Gracilibacteria bacterium]|nr:hypothetical protein [Candidatus Gracilibacteria bacterium]
MKFNKKGTTIVEAIIVLLIVTTGVVGAFEIYKKSSNLTISTQNRLQAIDIASEGIEALTNIRDTNWLVFAANRDNCWNTLNYNNNCLTATNQTPNISAGNYIINKNIDNRWILTRYNQTNFDYTNTTYRNYFIVKKDTNGFYIQGSGDDFNPVFTREIKISYPSTPTHPREKMIVESIVKWQDNTSKNHYEVKLETTLSNWIK